MTTRMQMIEIDEQVTAAPQVPAPSQVVVDGQSIPIVYAPGQAAAGVEVSAVARARILAMQARLEARGYKGRKLGGEGGVTAWKGLAIGTRVAQAGDERLAQFRQAHELKPLALAGMEQLAACVDAEGRVQVDDVALASILCRYNPDKAKATGDARHVDGALALKNGAWHVIAPTPTALQHLAGFLGSKRPDGLVGYLPYAPPAVRAAIVEEYRQDVGANKRVSIALKTNVPSELAGATTCYRVASPGYTAYEVNTAIRDLLANEDVRSLLRDARLEAVYDGNRARLKVIWHADHVIDFAAGDVYKCAGIFTLDDVRGRSVSVDGAAWRNACLNLMIIGRQNRRVLRRRHTGEVTSIASEFVAAVQSLRADFAEFIDAARASRQDRILDAFDGDPRAVFEGLVGAGLVAFPGRAEVQVERLMSAYEKEPGFTRADILNAVTRAAHEETWWTSFDQSEQAEEQAGQLLYMRNLTQRVQVGREDYLAGQEARA